MRGVARETSGPEQPAAARPVARETHSAAPASGPAPEPAPRGRLARLTTLLLLVPIRLYRRLISPLLGPRCRYYPTCSSYAEQALRELGPVRGTILAGWRVLRCNPFSAGGLDPLENRRLFRSRPRPNSSADPEAPV